MAQRSLPGPDELPVLVYQQYRSLLKEEVRTMVRDFLNGVYTPTYFNIIVIVLIPKVISPELLNQFRLINLCNIFI
jgi:hypothetical protein